ncbi:MAG: NEW3 domain-containing protein [Deltaproteobacteria bacterium]|nr:NEW3 domain-containing protein [Deltaproteobacteria bacterium]
MKRMRQISLRYFLAITLWLCGATYFLPYAFAEEGNRDLPPRDILVAPEYASITIPEGTDVNVDVVVRNGGRQGEIIDLFITSVPEGWKAWIETYSFKVGGVFVESDSRKSLTLKAEPEKEIGIGKYVFPIKAQTRDGRLTSSSELVVSVEGKKEEKKFKGIDINTSYPVLRGPTDAKFEFSIDVENKTDKEAIFNLAYEAPKNWEINFKPSYEDKYFSSLRIKKDQSQTMAVEVKPYVLAEPGEYPIVVKVSSDKAKGEVSLTVVLTGTHKLDAGTADGRLSLTTYQGKPANLSFYVKNSGSAPQDNIQFLSFKPENWNVEFSPEKIETLPAGELKQVEMTVIPAEQALVGDYSVAVNVEGEKTSKNMEFRITVRAATAWGWVGIGIILAVVAGLVFLFVRLGRR